MNLDELTLGQLKAIQSLLTQSQSESKGLCGMLGKKVIIRTYSAGVWFGTLSEKDRSEVILKDARRMYRWWAYESISLSAASLHGIKHDKSKICEPVSLVWLEAIEILPCTPKAIGLIEGAENVKAE